MIVCICHRYREQDIRSAAHSGLRSAHDVYKRLGAGPNCGRCLEIAEQVIQDVHLRTPATNPARAANPA